MQDKACKFLVICPKSIIKSAWLEDQQNFYADMRLLPISRNMSKEDYTAIAKQWHDDPTYSTHRLTIAKLKDMLCGDAQVYVINPESFKADIKTIRSLGIQGLVLDESSMVKNPQSQTTKAITDFAKELDYVYILSGKPAPNNQMEYYSQMNLIDPSLLGSSFFSFRGRYFHPTGYGGYTWELNPGAEDRIAERISRKSLFIRKEDCLDLPEKTYLRRMVELPAEAMKQYKMMEAAQVAILDDTAISAPNKMAALMKLRQITSGFIYGEGGTVAQLHDAKMDELMAVLDEIGNKQVIIWCQFKEEIKSIMIELAKRPGVSAVDAYSGTRDLDESISLFKHGQAQYMIAHPATLKYGVTFTNCTYAVYYSQSYSYEEYYQSHDRIYRKGQTLPCTFLFLLAEDTIDNIIYKVLQEKGDTARIIEDLVRAYR